MTEVLVTAPRPPKPGTTTAATTSSPPRCRARWRGSGGSPSSRRSASAQRFGRQSATELWGALFLRYHGFPWDGTVVTTAAISTGLNWASTVTDVEQDRADDEEGSRWMHFFSPEITFALPSRPNVELLLRFHHRSGVFGLVSDARGGAQYATVGLRLRF